MIERNSILQSYVAAVEILSNHFATSYVRLMQQCKRPFQIWLIILLCKGFKHEVQIFLPSGGWDCWRYSFVTLLSFRLFHSTPTYSNLTSIFTQCGKLRNFLLLTIKRLRILNMSKDNFCDCNLISLKIEQEKNI